MNYTILVADDDDDDFVLWESYIRQCHQNVELVHVKNGVEATHKLIEGLHPNLIMVDAHMPLMSGYELLVWLMKSASWRHVPIVIWTGDMSDSDITRFYQAGANTVLLKQDALQSVQAFCHHWFELVKLPELIATYGE